MSMLPLPMGGSRMEAQLSLPAVSVQVWHFDLPHSGESLLRDDHSYRLDLGLNRRLPGTGLCFADHWASSRFETPGRLFLLPPGETMRVRSGVGQQGAIVCHLPVSRLAEWLDIDLEWTERKLEASLNVEAAKIGHLLMQLAEEARNPGFAGEALTEAIAVQIAIHLERFYRDVSHERKIPNGLAAWRLRLIDDRLKDVADSPSLSELATLCKMSVRQLSRGFRTSRSLSIGEYVTQESVRHAKRLLGSGQSVKSVAYTLGFASPSSFSFAFRKATGASPSEFQTRIRID